MPRSRPEPRHTGAAPRPAGPPEGPRQRTPSPEEISQRSVDLLLAEYYKARARGAYTNASKGALLSSHCLGHDAAVVREAGEGVPSRA